MAGIPIPGVEVRIADNGALLGRSPGVMRGKVERRFSEQIHELYAGYIIAAQAEP